MDETLTQDQLDAISKDLEPYRIVYAAWQAQHLPGGFKRLVDTLYKHPSVDIGRFDQYRRINALLNTIKECRNT
jgi:hypothetical protein